MMLNRQSQPAALTEENLKRHQAEAKVRQTPLKRFTARQVSFRSAGDGESVELQCDEQIFNTSTGEQTKDEKERITNQLDLLVSNASSKVDLENMKKQSEKSYSQKSSAVETNYPLSLDFEKRQLKQQHKDNGPFKEETFEFGSAFHSNNNDELEKENSENADSEVESNSSSSLSTDSDDDDDVANNGDKELQNSNCSAASSDSSRSSSPLLDDDDDDSDEDEDDDDDDDDTEEEETENNVKSDDELTHYTSSLNASVSSIPTLNDDRESLDTPSGDEESPKDNEDENEELVTEEKEDDNTDQRPSLEATLEENTENKISETVSKHDNLSPPQSRKVSGRSTSPSLTVVVSEFDEVESTIFDRRQASSLGSSPRNKFTSSESIEGSEISIKNWVSFDTGCIITKTDTTGQGLYDQQSLKTKENKQLKTRKQLNAMKTHFIKSIRKNIPSAKVFKHQALSKTAKEKTDQLHLKNEVIKMKKNSLSSDDSDGVCKEQKKLVRRKLKGQAKRVSFDDSKMNENVSKTTTSDSAFFGSRTTSRDNKEDTSPRPPESEHSGRASSQWSVLESERSTGSGTRPDSTVQSPCSISSSIQTTLVNDVTFPSPVSPPAASVVKKLGKYNIKSAV